MSAPLWEPALVFFLLFEEVGYPVLLSYEPAKPGCAGTDLYVKEDSGQHKAQATEERCRRTIPSRSRHRLARAVGRTLALL